MSRCFQMLLLAGSVLALLVGMAAAAAPVDERWSDPDEVEKQLDDLADDHKRAGSREIGRSAGGRPLWLLTIEPAAGRDGDEPGPAVLVTGDPTGATPLAAEAVLVLAREILAADETSAAAAVRWYLLPVPNPDGAAKFFTGPRQLDGRNSTPVDDDKDGAFGEDGPDDLDGDGFLGVMYLADPDGEWSLTGDPPLPHPLNPARDDGPRYRLLPEGVDDDRDGLWNEDGPGGVNPGLNFPHRFEHWTADGGLWPGDQPESRAVLDFAFTHRDIAMVLVLGVNNTWRMPVEDVADKPAAVQRYQFPETRAKRVGVSPATEFSLAEVVELLRENRPDRLWDERRALRYLGEDAATKLNADDLVWWKAMAESYQVWIDSTGAAGERLGSPPPGAGNLAEWAYFHYGVPSFAVDFWSLPMAPADTAAADSLSGEQNDQADDDKDNDWPDAERWQTLAAFTARIAGDPAYADWPGLQPWRNIDLPDERRALTGGPAPYCFTTPPAALVDSLLSAQVPFLLTLPDWLPGIAIESAKLTRLHTDVYELEVRVANPGRLPYPTAHGVRTGRLAPVAVTVENAEVIEGRARQTITNLPSRGSRAVRWVLRAETGKKLRITARAPSLGLVRTEVVCNEEGGR